MIIPEVVSDCCSAYAITGYVEQGICPRCGEHCNYIDLSEDDD